MNLSRCLAEFHRLFCTSRWWGEKGVAEEAEQSTKAAKG